MPDAREGTALLGIAGRRFSAWASAVLAMRGGVLSCERRSAASHWLGSNPARARTLPARREAMRYTRSSSASALEACGRKLTSACGPNRMLTTSTLSDAVAD